MRRFVAGAVMTCLMVAALFAVQPAGAKSLAGKKCSKLGQKKVHEGKTFVCRKRGGALVWVTVKTPTPTPTPSPTPTTQLTRAECEGIWYDYQYASVAPDFPVTRPLEQAEALHAECQDFGLLPDHDTRVRLTQDAFSATAQILEKRISEVSAATGQPPCRALSDVIKPVGPYGRQLRPGDDVEGYASDSFLPILRYNWYGGPFRLKFGVGCEGAPYANLWFVSDPYPPASSHPERYPSDEEVKQDPWPRTPVGGPMSTCITWGPGLGNDRVGGRGFIMSFSWDHTNLPEDVNSCYPKALGLDGLDAYPFQRIPNLEARSTSP